MGVPDHHTCFWETCKQVKKQKLEPDIEHLPGSKLGKEFVKVVYCYSAYLTYMQNARLDEAQAGIKIAGRNNLRYADDITLMAESEEELKSLLMKVKEKWKILLETQHSEIKIVASGPIISWQIDGKTMKTVADFICFGSKTTADADCSHEIKRHLLLGRKAMTDIDSILKKVETLLGQQRSM